MVQRVGMLSPPFPSRSTASLSIMFSVAKDLPNCFSRRGCQRAVLLGIKRLGLFALGSQIRITVISSGPDMQNAQSQHVSCGYGSCAHAGTTRLISQWCPILEICGAGCCARAHDGTPCASCYVYAGCSLHVHHCAMPGLRKHEALRMTMDMTWP